MREKQGRSSSTTRDRQAVKPRPVGPASTATGKPKGISPEALQAAQGEAKRRIAARDKREAERAAHEERVGPFQKHIGAAIGELDVAFPRSDDGEPNSVEQEVRAALVTVMLACHPPGAEEADDADVPAPPPALGSPTRLELERLLRRAQSALPTVREPRQRAGYEVVVEQLRALCDAARATGTVDESALAACDPRIADMLKRERADRVERETWRTAPSRRARPGESLEVITARVLVERGHTQFEATRVVLGMRSDEARDSSLRKRVGRAVKAQAKLAATPEDEELTPESIAELERALEESQRRSH